MRGILPLMAPGHATARECAWPPPQLSCRVRRDLHVVVCSRQRILSEIACQLSAAEPRLARALAAGRLPSLRRRLLAARSRRRPVQSIWLAPVVIITSLATGIALLTAGLVLGILVLCYVGAVLVQFGPAACAYLYMRAPQVPPIARHALLLVGQPGAGAEQAQLSADRGLTVKRSCITPG